MLINLAGFVFAAGLMAFVFSYLYRRLESWDVGVLVVNPVRKWILRFVGLGLMLSSGALFSYSMPGPVAYVNEPTNTLVDEEINEPLEEWLSLMDGANYEGAWKLGAPALQQSVSASEFERLAKSRRLALGKVLDRAEISSMELSSLPDGRQGNFRLHIFRTVFASGAQFEETVVEEADSDDWKVLNYNLGHISK